MEERGLEAVLPREVGLDSLPDYYQHVAELFESEHQYAYAVPFYKLAIESAGDDMSTRDLWYNVFRGQLAMKEWEQAYVSVGLMNDPALQVLFDLCGCMLISLQTREIRARACHCHVRRKQG